MRVVPAEAKTLLIRRRRVDSWFVSALGMNLYRGCGHAPVSIPTAAAQHDGERERQRALL